jgi:uncharacterized protein YcfJ
MIQRSTPAHTGAAAFSSFAAADQAIRHLMAAGFTQDEISVVAPAEHREQSLALTPHVENPTENPSESVVTGVAAGAAIGGLVLATAALTGGLSLIGASIMVGGSAIAGGFSSLVVRKGYETEASDYCKRAIQNGQIVVGVDVVGEDAGPRFEEATRILREAGGQLA